MGEEYGERAPFQFFTDHDDPEIAEATREGRRKEFAPFAAFADEDVPDPQAPETFERSKLDPESGDAELRAFYRELIAAAPRAAARGRDERRRGAADPARAPRRASSSSPTSPNLTVRDRTSLMEVWPGTPFPLGPTWDGRGHELLALLRERRARRALPVRRRRARDARRADRAHRVQLALLPARRRARASATATASTARTSPSRARASTRRSC